LGSSMAPSSKGENREKDMQRSFCSSCRTTLHPVRFAFRVAALKSPHIATQNSNGQIDSLLGFARMVVASPAKLLYAERMSMSLAPGSDRIEPVETFVRIVEAGSLSAAANSSGNRTDAACLVGPAPDKSST